MMGLLACFAAPILAQTSGLCSPSSSSTPALPSKITNLLLHRLKARNNSLAASSTTTTLPINQHPVKQQEEYREVAADLSDTQFPDFLNDPEDYTPDNDMISDCMTTSFESSLNEKENYGVGEELDLDYNWSDLAHSSSVDCNIGGEIEEEGGIDVGVVDFHFVDEFESSYCSPFEIAEEIVELMEKEAYGDEPSTLREAMKRMKYERKFSASLYAFNGIPECLKLKLGSSSVTWSDQLTKLRNVCNKNQEQKKVEEVDMDVIGKEEEESPQTSINIGSSSASSDGELSLWSSLDLPPICFVN